MIGYIAPFKILDYLDRLNVVRQTGTEYHCTCPVCGDGGFKIDKNSGKYYGFKCRCEVKDIREAIRPWDEVKGLRKQTTKSAPTTKPNPKIELALLPQPATDIPSLEQKDIPNWLIKQGIPVTATQTRYWYSKNQWVSRFEWQTPTGKAKTIRQGHIKSNGLIEWKKGSKDWLAYRLSEAPNTALTSGY